MTSFSYTTGNVTLQYWNDNEFVQQEIVLKVACKMVEQAIELDCVATLYALMNRDPFVSEARRAVSAIEITETKEHLQALPGLEFGAVNGYGETDNIQSPTSIRLNDNMFELSKRCTSSFHKFRYAFLIWVTIMHELSHWKIRRATHRASPKKFFPGSTNKGGESGQFLEINLLGGVVYSLGHAKNVGKGLAVKKSNDVYRIADNFIRDFVNNLVAGNLAIASDFEITSNKLRRVPKQKSATTRTKKRPRPKVETDSDDDEVSVDDPYVFAEKEIKKKTGKRRKGSTGGPVVL